MNKLFKLLILVAVVVVISCNSSRNSNLYSTQYKQQQMRPPNVWADGRTEKVRFKSKPIVKLIREKKEKQKKEKVRRSRKKRNAEFNEQTDNLNDNERVENQNSEPIQNENEDEKN